jgi:hypothetical protein
LHLNHLSRWFFDSSSQSSSFLHQFHSYTIISNRISIYIISKHWFNNLPSHLTYIYDALLIIDWYVSYIYDVVCTCCFFFIPRSTEWHFVVSHVVSADRYNLFDTADRHHVWDYWAPILKQLWLDSL